MDEYIQLIAIVKNIINDEATFDDSCVHDWNSIIALARQHSLLVYVYLYASKLSLEHQPNQEVMLQLENYYANEVVRDTQQLHAVSQMREIFERHGITNLFVKGAVTKYRYKNELLRSMGDIDFLYKPSQDKQVRRVMMNSSFNLEVEVGFMIYMNEDDMLLLRLTVNYYHQVHDTMRWEKR